MTFFEITCNYGCKFPLCTHVSVSAETLKEAVNKLEKVFDFENKNLIPLFHLHLFSYNDFKMIELSRFKITGDIRRLVK